MFYLQLAFAGLIAGGAYALSSIGMVAIYKGNRVINFAQGAIGMVGTYVFANWIGAGHNYVIGVLLGVGTSAVLGLLAYVAVMLPLRKSSGLTRMVASFGILLLLEGLADLRWGSVEQSVRPMASGYFTLGQLELGKQSLIALVVALVFAAALSLYFEKTKYGRQTEAASLSAESASRLGYNVNILGAITWLIGSTAAGVAGILLVPALGLNETNLTLVVIGAMVGALMGSFRHIWLAVIASFALGIIEALITGLITAPTLSGLDQAVPLVIVIILLLFGADAIPTFAGEHERLPIVPRSGLSLRSSLIALCAIGIGVGVFNPYWQSLLAQAAGLAIVALSLVLVVGYIGQISLMQWSLAGVGAFCAAWAGIDYHVPFLVTLLVGGAASAGIAFLLGLPALRLRGVTLAIVTLSMSVTIQSVILIQFANGSGYTLPNPSIGVSLNGRWLSAVSIAILAVVATSLLILRRSWTGKRLIALRASERAAASIGVGTYWTKALVFAAGGFIAGVGGALYVWGLGAVNSTSFDPVTALTLLSLVYINGVGAISAGIAAGAGVAMGPTFLSNFLHLDGAGWFNVLGGVGLIVTLLRNPDGVFVRERQHLIHLEDGTPEVSSRKAGIVKKALSSRKPKVSLPVETSISEPVNLQVRDGHE